MSPSEMALQGQVLQFPIVGSQFWVPVSAQLKLVP